MDKETFEVLVEMRQEIKKLNDRVKKLEKPAKENKEDK